jgi:hypothetical protein
MKNTDKYKNAYNFEDFLGEFNDPFAIYNSLPSKAKRRLDQQRYSSENKEANYHRREYREEPHTLSGKFVDKEMLGASEIAVLQRLLNDATGIYDNQEVDISPSSTFNMQTASGWDKSPYFTMEGALMPAPQMGSLEKLMQRYRQEKR